MLDFDVFIFVDGSICWFDLLVLGSFLWMVRFVAVSVERNQFTLITRNVSDFELFEIRLENPWD